MEFTVLWKSSAMFKLSRPITTRVSQDRWLHTRTYTYTMGSEKTYFQRTCDTRVLSRSTKVAPRLQQKSFSPIPPSHSTRRSAHYELCQHMHIQNHMTHTHTYTHVDTQYCDLRKSWHSMFFYLSAFFTFQKLLIILTHNTTQFCWHRLWLSLFCWILNW